MSLLFDYSAVSVMSGLSSEKISEQVESMKDIVNRIHQEKADGALGFAALPYQDGELKPIENLAMEVRAEFSTLIVIGIGGSDLGARAVHRALNHQFYNLLAATRKGSPQLFFLGDTTDPVAICEVLDVVDLKATAIAVISKSGNTVEQMSTFVYLRKLLIDKVGEEASKKHIIILTDKDGGTLREIVNIEGYRSLVVPADVGGRFSVLSSVGLFPLAVAGVNIRLLLEGARELDADDAEAVRYAAVQYLAYESGKNISVLMPYAYSLREVGFWFRQLWAESLGKRYDREGKEIFIGPTPIAAVGPTDQHSQVQLYMEGPLDKIFTFIVVDKPAVNMALSEAYPEIEGVRYLAGHDFDEILRAEQQSTAQALAEEKRPSCVIHMPVLDEKSLGELLYFFELSVTYMGALLNINAFDQPGVEIGKKHMYRLLGRSGF
jgi:glucose-6-phosphate isomerase